MLLNNTTPITIAQLLESREARMIRQHQLIEQYQGPLISLTITMPGEIKLNDSVLFLYHLATEHILNYCKINQIECPQHIQSIKNSGPEGFFVINWPEQNLKHLCIEIEHSHPLGRLWDIDVISVKDKKAISRTELGYPSRRCLICNDDAKVCARSRNHALSDVIQTIETMVADYQANPH